MENLDRMGCTDENVSDETRCFIFTGQTGVEHKQVMQRLALFTAEQEGLRPNLADPDVQKWIKIYYLEDEIKNLLKTDDITVFLDSYNEEKLEGKWTEAFEKISHNIEEEKPRNALISMHATFHRYGRLFSPLNWESIRNLQPVCFLTLIDDVYSIWHRINWREQDRAATGSYFRLRELASWRSIETLMTDRLAKYVYPGVSPAEKNFVIAIKDPISMLYNLLFHPEKLIVYIGFHITATRDDPEIRGEIDNFRWAMHEQFTVFDPISVDEKILEFAYQEKTGHKVTDDYMPNQEERIELQEKHRWKMSTEPGQLLVYEHEGMEVGCTSFPISLSAVEVKEVAENLTHQIQIRDYRLIRQADRVAHYRPQYGGEISGGVSSEIQYARDTALVPYAAVFNEEADGEPDRNFFTRVRTLFPSTDKLIEDFRKHEAAKMERYEKVHSQHKNSLQAKERRR